MDKRGTPKDGWLAEEIAKAKANIASWPKGYADGLSMAGADLSELAALRAEVERLKGERDEAYRRRDAWRAKADGFDEMAAAVRSKVTKSGPSLSRILLHGALAETEARCRKSQAEVERLREALMEIAGQKKTTELERNFYLRVACFEDGYDSCIARARAALEDSNGTA